MTLTKEFNERSNLEHELEQLKDELAQRLMHNAPAASVSEIETRIQRTWAAIDEAC